MGSMGSVTVSTKGRPLQLLESLKATLAIRRLYAWNTSGGLQTTLRRFRQIQEGFWWRLYLTKANVSQQRNRIHKNGKRWTI